MLPSDHPTIATGGVGVLLVNLGTPDAPTPDAVRRYLAEFLSDRRVVEYWQRLRPFIERPHSPVDDPPVLAAAQASFAHFNAVASQVGAPETTI